MKQRGVVTAQFELFFNRDGAKVKENEKCSRGTYLDSINSGISHRPSAPKSVLELLDKNAQQIAKPRIALLFLLTANGCLCYEIRASGRRTRVKLSSSSRQVSILEVRSLSSIETTVNARRNGDICQKMFTTNEQDT